MTLVLDMILLAMALEAVALLAWRRLKVMRFLPNLCSGMALMATVRLALAGAWWGWLCLLLLLALAGHVLDLAGARKAP